MPRKANLEPRKRIERRKRANGDVYVYEKTTRYDPEKGYEVSLGYRLLGKIPAGKKDMRIRVPGTGRTNRKLRRQSVSV